LTNILKRELFNGYYIDIMIKPIQNVEWIQEVLIYGYSDFDKVFYAMEFKNHVFKRVDYNYEYIASILEEVKSHFYENSHKGMSLSCWYQYPVTLFKINDNYCKDNSVFAAYRKMINELHGGTWELNRIKAPGKNMVYSQIHKGLSCLDALNDLLHKVLNGEINDEKDHRVVPALKKLHEHRKIMVITMKYVWQKWERAFPARVVDYISSYKECSDVVGKWLNMSLKYELTRNTELIRSIISEIPKVAEKEFECLLELVHNCIDWDKFNENYM